MRFGNSDIAVGRQVFNMQSLFPTFKYQRVRHCPTWTGTLAPTGKNQYVIKVEYLYPLQPTVWIVRPQVHKEAPHRYSNGSLCLHLPKDRSWSPTMFIAETILPWTAEWLAFYEIWLLTRKWYGPEAPHGRRKKMPKTRS